MTLLVYTGKDAEFSLYEDEGTNYNYEKGNYSTINIRYNEQSKTLNIGKIKGEYTDMVKKRIFRIEWITNDGKTHPQTAIEYVGNSLSQHMP